MALIPDETIEQILERVDIVELASRYMSLKRSGINNMGCCPFHDEKTPSFNVNSSRQRYHCFGCKEGGHAITLLMHFEGLNFPEACKRLAGEVGIDIEERQASPAEERRRKERESLQRVNAVAAEFFHRQLLEAADAEGCRQYLNRRGYGRTSAAEYQLGYAPDRWDALTEHLEQQRVDPAEARSLGLIRSRDKSDGDYDLFRGRLIFPIHDLSGRIIAFGGRILGDGQPKYINSPDSPIYHKGEVLFGLYTARQAIRQAAEVILVEGYFDQLALTRAGVGNSVATCGTALTTEHAQLLKRYAKRVLLLFDNDAAGLSATFKAMELLLPTGLETAVIELEAGEDPDSFLQKRGKDVFAGKLQAARPVIDLFMQDRISAAPAGAAGMSRAALQVLEKLVLLPNPLELDLSLKELAQQTKIEVDLLRQQLEEVRQQLQQRNERQKRRPSPRPAEELTPPPGPVTRQQERPGKKFTPAEAKLLKLLIFETEVRQQIATQGAETFFYEESPCKLATKLLDQLQDVVVGQEVTRLQQSDLFEQLPQPLTYDPDEYAGVGKGVLDSQRKKTALERQKQQLKENS